MRFKPIGKANSQYYKLRLTNEQNIKLFPKLKKLSRKYKILAQVDCSMVPIVAYHKPNYKLLDFFGAQGCVGGNTYIEINNQPIKEFGISFGLGLPFRRSKSMLNFAFEFGNKGTVENDLVQENFFKFTFGLSIYERWFVKNKYR